MTGDSMLSVRGVSKYFGDFPANKEIDLNIQAGEIHALLGENGAGKSTLVKMLYGSLQPTAGEIHWKGNQVDIVSPAFARSLGIGMVFQHFSLFDALNVAENIALSLPEDVSVASVPDKALAYSEKYGLPLNPDALVGDLSVGERQRVEIVRCLLQEPELLILDEPTSVLTPQEAENLFETVNLLKSEGRSVLFISHRLEEVRAHCDSATILRFGEVIESCDPRQETAASMARMMVGEDVRDVSRSDSGNLGDAILEVSGLSAPSTSPFAVALHDVSFSVQAGEVLGIAGIAGNGQSELFEMLCGERLAAKPDAISVRNNQVGTKGVNERRRLGAAFIPEERNGHGAIGTCKLSENMLLARHQSDKEAFLKAGVVGVIGRDKIAGATKRVCEAMDVRKSGDDPFASSLSGGNLQKFIVGRELDRQPTLMIVNQPSWGVDAGAAQRIRQALVDLARNGAAVLVLSQDLDELFELSDRIAVLFEGHLSQPRPASDITREEIGLLMAGVNENGQGEAA
ncbi:MAG: ABC transporter ATP-binding protein [Pseudomonadota bacterium]